MFSKGFIWFYWEHHKNGGKRIQLPGNENDFDGYTEQQLYVPCKYETYKQEILSHLNIDSYNLILTKAKQYLQTREIKSLTPHELGYYLLKYGISKDDHIKLEHITALILYCDFTAYCTEFSSTFRRITSVETIEQAKKRNSRFWFQSKYFREIVECFGSHNAEDFLSGRKTESGPFFTGLDVVLAVPEFSIRLCSPTSTSMHVSVSLNFSKRSGMIIELNNPQEDRRSSVLSFFDVSWISRFPDEDERVFVGMDVSFILHYHLGKTHVSAT